MNSVDVMKRYLEDAIAAEQHFEKQLRAMAEEGDHRTDAAIQQLFRQHADETQRQRQRLITRLEALGGSPSAVKSFVANLFNFAPKAAQIGREEDERTTQNLIVAYAIEQGECAMYEGLATAAAAAGDTATERLARELQQEERIAAEKIWAHIPSCAAEALRRVTSLQAA